MLEEYSEDEDFNELLNLYVYPRIPRGFRIRSNNFEKWSDSEYVSRFRLSKGVVHLVLEEIGDALVSASRRNKALTPEQILHATLRFLATGSILQVIGDFSGIDKSTASRHIDRCLGVLARLGHQFIKMPSTQEEIDAVRQGFYSIARFPRCIGALDCTHVRIQSPGGEDAEIFRNRKGFFSFNVQAICDSNLKFQNIVARWPGSVTDSIIFLNSRVRRNMEFHEYSEESLLVGDSGYAVSNYLMTPLQNPQLPAEILYNESQIRTRNPIERAFGVWKRRFPILALGIRLKIDKVEKIIVATAVLHNIAIQMKENVPPVNDGVQEAINLLANMNLQELGQRNPANELVRFTLIHEYFQQLL